MARGDVIRREDWVILAVMMVGAGVALNNAAADGSDLTPFDGGVRFNWRRLLALDMEGAFGPCGAHPWQCFNDLSQRFGARYFWTTGMLAVVATVFLRRFWPRVSGVPYGILLLSLAALVYTGQMDAVLRSLDPREVARALQSLMRPPAPAAPATPAAPRETLNCIGGATVCAGGRGGLARTIPGGMVCDPQYVECQDGSVWDRAVRLGGAPVQIAPPRAPAGQAPRCMPPALLAGGVPIRRVWQAEGRCGWLELVTGTVYDLTDGAEVRPDYWTRIKQSTRMW